MSKSFVQNASDEEQVKKASVKTDRKRDQEIRDVRWILNSRDGRRFIWRYLGECGVFKTSFTGSSQTFFLEGQRNIGLKLLADINDANPEAYVLMNRESREDFENV